MSADEFHNRMISTLKAAAWERAKAALMEMVAIEGSRHGGARSDDGRFRHQILQEDHIEPFVNSIELDELNL